MVKFGPSFGYYPKASKTFLVMKEEWPHIAEQAFVDTDVNITTQGKRYLGIAVGSMDFRDEFVPRKVKQWYDEVELLSNVALSQPHAAFVAHVHGQASKWLCLSNHPRYWSPPATSRQCHPRKVHPSHHWLCSLL